MSGKDIGQALLDPANLSGLFGNGTNLGGNAALTAEQKQLTAEQQAKLKELDQFRIRLSRSRSRGNLLTQNVPTSTLG